MFLTRAEMDARLSSERNVLNPEANFKIIRPGKPGRKPDVPNMEHETHVEVGALARLLPHKNVAETFDISTQTVSNLTNGKTDGRTKDEILLHDINEKLAPVASKAIDKLVMSLDLLGKEKLANSKATELSKVAKDMASIADMARPVVKDENTNKPQFIFYAPRFHKEEFYDTVDR